MKYTVFDNGSVVFANGLSVLRIPFDIAAYLVNIGAQAQREATYAPSDVIMDIEFGDLDPLQVLKDAAS